MPPTARQRLDRRGDEAELGRERPFEHSRPAHEVDAQLHGVGPAIKLRAGRALAQHPVMIVVGEPLQRPVVVAQTDVGNEIRQAG
jgi:hypothetical protein